MPKTTDERHTDADADLPTRILAVFSTADGAPLKAKDVGRALGMSADERSVVREALREMASHGALHALDGKRFVLPGAVTGHQGRIERKASGIGWFIPEDKKLPDAFVPPDALAFLADGDIVLAETTRAPKGPVARILRVVARRQAPVLGTLSMARSGKGFAPIVEPDVQVMSGPIFVEAYPGAPDVSDGDLVELEMVRWPSTSAAAAGRIVKNLGRRGALDVEIGRILSDKGVRGIYPAAALTEAEAFPVDPTPEDCAGRVDLRALPLVTIDGETAKDFDDAVHARFDGQDLVLTVAIADVSHYVREGSALDAEAFARGTSVYWPGQVEPMLPEAISNGLCSLKPLVDRLCTVCEMRVHKDGSVSDERFFVGVMKSHARLTYTIVQAFLDGDGDAKRAIPPQVHDSLLACLEASKRLRAARQARGALDFDLPELVVALGPDGKPTEIRPLVRLYAHKLIEDLMVAANEASARYFEKQDWPSVYRIHEPPDEEKLERFLKLARFAAGRRLDELDSGATGRGLMEVMRALSTHPAKRALDTLLLRSMMQARYSTENLGHYGLASDAYLHFTSPIRRYPDLIVHRLLKQRLKAGGRKNKSQQDEDLRADLDAMAQQSSDRERVANDAERAIDALLCAWLMKDRIGETFDGVVQSVTEFGLFVLLEPDTVEALLHVRDMPGDFWSFDEVNLALRGERTGARFGLGERVRVTLTNVDLDRRQLSLALGEGAAVGAPPPPVPRGGRGFDKDFGDNERRSWRKNPREATDVPRHRGDGPKRDERRDERMVAREARRFDPYASTKRQKPADAGRAETPVWQGPKVRPVAQHAPMADPYGASRVPAPAVAPVRPRAMATSGAASTAETPKAKQGEQRAVKKAPPKATAKKATTKKAKGTAKGEKKAATATAKKAPKRSQNKAKDQDAKPKKAARKVDDNKSNARRSSNKKSAGTRSGRTRPQPAK